MNHIRKRFGFFLSVGLVLAGSLAVVVMYIQVFNKNNELSRLRAELTAVQEANVAQSQTVQDGMNMNDLYVYATEVLGMEEADAATTIRVSVTAQSFTSSNLPTAEAEQGKVRFHWFR